MVRAELSTIENAIETKRIELLDKEKSLDALTLDLRGLEREIAETERVIAVSTTERANLTEYVTKLALQESDVIQRTAATESRKKELETAGGDLGSEVENLRQELAEKNEAVKVMENSLSEQEETTEAKRREIFRIAEDISHRRNEMGRVLTSIENLERKHAATLKESEAAREQLSRIETSIRETDGTLISENNELLLLNEQARVLSADIEEYRTKAEDSRNAIVRVREELASASSRLDSLREIMHEDLPRESLAEDLRIIASVAEVIDVDEAYEKAIENALFDKINGFIVQSLDDISAAVPSLKGKGMRRTAFVPLTMPSAAMNDPSERAGDISSGAIVGKASDLVRIHSEGDDIPVVLKSFLNDITVVRDLHTAFSLLREPDGRGHARSTFVTLDGEVVEPSGAVFIGEGKGILKRKREIRELDVLIEDKKSEMGRLGETLETGETSLLEKQGSLKDIESAIIDAEKEISLLRLTAENRNEDKERMNRKLSFLSIERGETLRETESLKAIVSEKESEAERMMAKKSEVELFVTAIQDEIARNKERYEAERASITDLRLALNTSRERIESIRKEMESSVETLADLARTRETLAQEQSGTGVRILQCSEEIAKNDSRLRGLVLRADGLKTVITESREVIRNESEELIKAEQESKAHRSRLDSLTSAINEADISIAEHRLKIETVSGVIGQNYGVEIATFEAEPVSPQDEERLLEIRTKIQELGPVNLGSLDEYEELKTRYEFLTQQQDDLNKSIAELEEAITKINSTTRKKLRDAFDQLNAKFSEVFVLLFGGGKAGLVLTDENNILDSGIDIIVQPPGKKLQNISLLSGGEKALTALSLLFASFLIKPSPLCILDEVDAALDESNIDRFARMLRELAGNIQFIVVTHSRATMEAADYLYGITMEEPGVSKVISMQLVES